MSKGSENPRKDGKATEGALARLHMLLGESTEAVAFVGALRDLLTGAEEADACFILARGELAIERACRRELYRGREEGYSDGVANTEYTRATS